MKELVGQGKPFHSALDKAAGVLKRKVGTGAEFMKELMSLPGVKQTEIAERGLGDVMNMPKMTHEQFMSALGSKPAPAIKEKVLGKMSDSEFLEKANEVSEDIYGVPYGQLDHEKQSSIEGHIDEDTSHHRGLTLPGGENYREMLIKAPEAKDLFKGVSSHFGGERGILASMRLKDRIAPGDMGYALVNKRSGNKSQIFSTPEEAQAAMLSMPESMRPMLDIVQTRGADKKLLHLEELQSDWHQQGREHGYIDPNEIWNITKKMIRNEPLTQEENNNYVSSQYGPKVPNAPFKKNWEEMALKRLIHHAAEKGYHGIVVTPGHEQADRYSLKHHVGQVYAKPTGNGKYDVTIDQKNGDGFYDTARTGPIDINEIQNLIGKELAEKIASQDKEHTYSGLDLEVGGEGMKGFYDKKVPNILNSIGKKYGVKTQLHAHPIKTEREQMVPDNAGLGMIRSGKPEYAHAHHFPITENMRKDVLTNGLPLYAEGGGVPSQHRAQFEKTLADLKIRTELNKKYNDLYEKKRVENQPTIQEFYAMHGIQHKAEGGAVQPSLNHMRMALMTGGKIPYTDISNIGADEAPSMGVKAFINPNERNNMGPGGVQLPTGGIDMNPQQPGQQLMPQQPQQQPQGQPSPLSAGASSPLQQPPSNILQMTSQGQAMNAMTPPKMAKGGSAHYDPSPVLKKRDIEAMADRMARQMAGLENPNNKTIKQLAREQDLPIDIRSQKKMEVPIINFEELADASTVGVPGDPSRGGVVPTKRNLTNPKAGEVLHAIGGEKLENPVPLYGGKDYGAYGHGAGWASDLGASAGLFNVVKRLAEQYPNSKVLGHYHKMTPDSLNHAVHMLDAVISHHRPHESAPEHLANLNHLMRNVKTTSSKHDIPYPEFPGFENPADVMLHGAVNSGLRKKLIGLLSTEKYFPGGKQKMNDIIYALSHPELRNIETGAGGSAILEFDPTKELKESISPHPTYAHDIPSKLIGRTRYITPADILAPRSMHNARKEIAAMGKKVVPFNQAKMNIIREPIDQQYINQIGEYEQAMRKRLGYKKGGSTKLSTNKDVMQLELTRKPKKAK